MCAIAGVWSVAPVDPAQPAHWAQAMAQAMAHRGPDGQGVWSEPSQGLSLSHRRLAVRDVGPLGAQPMVDGSNRHVLVFNGEIDNHLEWRQHLTRRGCQLHSTSGDTEVLLQALIHWGPDVVCREAQGMFAWAWYDRGTRRLVLARDRWGKKPLQVLQGAWGMAFASQLQALRALPMMQSRVDPRALDAYLRWGYVQGPWSMIQGVQPVEPAHWQSFENGRRVGSHRYWSLAEAIDAGLRTRLDPLDATTDAVDARLRTAVRARMATDVPVGAFLSGGIDSALVTALMQQEGPGRVRTFSVGFDDAAYDESGQARQIAQVLGTDHHECTVDGSRAAALLPDLVRIADEPLADASLIPTTVLAQQAATSVKVVLTGDGGDEVFGGYARYRQSVGWLGWVGRWPPALRARLADALAQGSPAAWNALAAGLPAAIRPTLPASKAEKLGRWLRAESPPQRMALLLERWPVAALRPQAPLPVDLDSMEPDGLCADARLRPSEVQQAWEMRHYLVGDLLPKMDRATMWASIEARSPLLDARVLDISWQLPPALKAEGPRLKEVLRRLLGRHLPSSLFDCPKRGFSAPLAHWLAHELHEPARELLHGLVQHTRGRWNTGVIEASWQAQQQGRSHEVDRLWGLIVLEQWRRHWGVELP